MVVKDIGTLAHAEKVLAKVFEQLAAVAEIEGNDYQHGNDDG